jgi:hypothetical protein
VTHLRKLMLEELQRLIVTTLKKLYAVTSTLSKIFLDDSTAPGPLGSSARS